MDDQWRLAEDLLGGTIAMRAAATSRLPQWPAESDDAYKIRLSAATLYPAFERTVGVMAGKPFSRGLTFTEGTSEQMRAWCDDVDLEGRNLHSFASDMLVEALAFGLCGILVDYPPTTGADGRPIARTRADDRRLGLRPYMVAIKHRQLLGWRVEKVNGAPRLTMLRLLEIGSEPDGDYGEVIVRRVRVLRPGSWELWREAAGTNGRSGGYEMESGGATTLDIVPFVPIYGRRLGFMHGVSPLLNLAHLNVKHWQSQSDQDTILHAARVPILARSGVDESKPLVIGSGVAVDLPMGGELKWVEHTGAAINAGRQSLLDLQEQMIQTGAELLVATPGQRSATEANNDAEANKSELLRIVESFEDSLDMGLALMSRWVRAEETAGVSLFKDFGALTLSEASAQLVMSMQQGGLITKATAIREQQRRGVLSDDIDPQAEIEAVNEEGPSLGMMGDGDGE